MADAVVVPQVRQLERTVGLKDLTVAEMEGRLREMSATTFDGVFVWRISDFAKKRQDAVAGRAPAMFSPGMPDVRGSVGLTQAEPSLKKSGSCFKKPLT